MRSNYLGLFLIIFIIVAMMSIGGSLSLFFSLAGLIAVLGIVLGAMVFKFGFSGLKHSSRSREFRNQFCNFGSAISTNAGILATVTGLIQMFAQVEWTNPEHIGVAVSMGLTTMFYGYILSLAFKLGMTPLDSKELLN